ncbi:MAG: hypothetical protein IH933_07145 [Euryarchaeota archaeon]|nr:hypothetical protein [Euryarchaeota archaeon]
MERYTADAVSLLAYLVDSLPSRTDQIFAAAEAGEAVIQAPSTALGEILYSVSRDKDVRGVTLSGTPENAREALIGRGPISLAPIEETETVEYVRVIERFSIHDAFVVASHRTHETDAILTSDAVIRASGVKTVWN